jgi:hypothetical protein
MRQDYLREYLWMRGETGVRLFWYECALDPAPELAELLGEKESVTLEHPDGWCSVRLYRSRGGDEIIVFVKAAVAAIPPERLPAPRAEGLIWPDIDGPMTPRHADAMINGGKVWLKDSVLQRYEDNPEIDTALHRWPEGRWMVAPSYKGEWGFEAMTRVGRNLLRTDIRSVYKGVPEAEIVHCWTHALHQADVDTLDLAEQNIVEKVERLAWNLMSLTESLCALANRLGYQRSASEIFGEDWDRFRRELLRGSPALLALCRVAPVEMSQQAFMERVKDVVEYWTRFKPASLQTILRKLGCEDPEIGKLKSAKLLSAIRTVVEEATEAGVDSDGIADHPAPEDWGRKREDMAALFISHDIRIANAHSLSAEVLDRLNALGIDRDSLREGHGRALDRIMDTTAEAIAGVDQSIRTFLRMPPSLRSAEGS